MKLYSYVVTYDTGFAPNPFFGWCTLANCKPAIRRAAAIGDWIVGLTPRKLGNRLVYAMKVEEALSYEQYFADPRFCERIPRWDSGNVLDKCGDNIYEPLPDGQFRQLQSMHSDGPREDLGAKKHDLGGKRVLVSRQYVYFGSKAIDLPESLSTLRVGRAHRCRFPRETIDAFLRFIADLPSGVQAAPRIWPATDESWRDGLS